jgi:hypothetical protein
VGICASATRVTCFSVRRRQAIRSAIEMIASSWVAAKTFSSSSRAIPFSSFSLTISQMTPTGCRPASRHRSTAASV